LLSLGVLQLNRAEEKKTIISKRSIAESKPVINIKKINQNWQDFTFRSIKMTGHYDFSKQLLLDNQIFNKQLGYQVLTPFLLSDGETIILVDRGFIAFTGSRQVLPKISKQFQSKLIVGQLYSPPKRLVLAKQVALPGRSWPRRIQSIDINFLQSYFSQPLRPFLVRLSADDINAYQANLPQALISTQRHHGYAVQWFALAVVWLIGCCIVFYRNFREQHHDKK